MSNQVLTGQGVVIYVNKSMVGFATGIEYTRRTNVEYIYEIDSPFAAEVAPKGPYSVTGTLTGLRMKGSGGLDGSGIMDVSNVANFFTQKYVTLEIRDRTTDQAICFINRCLFDQDGFKAEVRSQMTFSATFRGIWVGNEFSTDSAG